MKKLYKRLKERDSRRKFKILKPYLLDGEKILDFGCGDLGLSNQIAKNFKKTNIVGVDVILLKKIFNKNKRIKFVRYDGRRLPFKNNSFDTLISFYVLHHCDDPESIIKECIRVVKKRLIVVESIPHKNHELPFMKFFDWFFNVIKFDMTPLPYRFYKLSKWRRIFEKNNVKLKIVFHPKSYEDYFPFGKMYILEFEKIN